MKLESMKVKEAVKITGSMTRTSKMPGLSYSLPAWECQTGAKLRQVPGTPCHGCYALKGNYIRYPAIKKAQYYRLDSLVHDSWVTAMVAQIKRQRWFRWHVATQKSTKVKGGYDGGTLFYYSEFEPVSLNKEYIKHKDTHEKHAEVKMIAQIGGLLSKSFGDDDVTIQGGIAKKKAN